MTAPDNGDDNNAPLTIAEEWRSALVGLHMQSQKQILSMLIDKGILTGGEAQSMMFELAEKAAARLQDIGYFLAERVEKLGNELSTRG